MMTTSQGSNFEDPTEIMTTTPIDIIDQTTGNSMTSSSSRGAHHLYYECAVVGLVVGFVGAALNGLVVYGMIASKQHKKQVLIFNQNLLDFSGCCFLFTTHAVKLCIISLSGSRGTHGYWLCVLILSEALHLGPLHGSFINLAAVTIERYLRVVHHVWAKKNLRKWMIYSLVIFTWIGGNAFAWGWTVPTTDVVDGVCYTLVLWKSRAAQMAFSIWYFVTFYVGLFLIFILCYGRILIVIRRQAKVMSSHDGSSTAQTQSNKTQAKIVKTMIIVSMLYIVLWTPSYLHNFLMNISSSTVLEDDGVTLSMLCIGFLYNCANPLIYVINLDPVKRVLLRLIPCNKNTQPVEGIGINRLGC